MIPPADSIKSLAFKLAGTSFQLNTHAIGDNANRVVLNAYRDALFNYRDPRWRVEHAQVLSEGDIELFNQKIIPSVQPTHATSDMYWLYDRIGKERAKHAYAFQSFAFLSRTKSFETIDKTKKYVFIERSTYSDKNVFARNCFMTGIMPEIHYNLYNEWFSWMENFLKVENTRHVYLRCDPNISFERQKKRNRGEESGLNLEYMTQIHERHEEWLMKDRNTIVLDASNSFNVNNDDMNQIVSNLNLQ